jgi:hypothetical protein
MSSMCDNSVIAKEVVQIKEMYGLWLEYMIFHDFKLEQ